MSRQQVLGLMAALFAATAYGTAYTASRVVYDHGLNALTLNTLRFAALVAIYLPLVLIAGSQLHVSARSAKSSLLLGVLIACAGIFNLSSIAFIPVSLAILVFYTYPLITLALSAMLDRQAPGMTAYIAFALTFSGLGLTLEVSFDQLNWTGVGLAFLGSLGAGAHMVVAQRSLQQGDFRTVMLYMSLAALVFTGSITVLSGEVSMPVPGVGLWMLGLITIAYCAGIGAMLAAVRWVGPVRTAMVMCMEPPVVITCAFLLLGERLAAIQLLGALLVIAGIVTAQRVKNAEQAGPT